MPLWTVLFLAALFSCVHQHCHSLFLWLLITSHNKPQPQWAACLHSPSYFPEYQLSFLLIFYVSVEFSAPILFFLFVYGLLLLGCKFKNMHFFFSNPILIVSYGRLFAKLATTFPLSESTLLCSKYDFVGPWTGRIYFPCPWIWVGLINCFAQLNVGKRHCHFQV